MRAGFTTCFCAITTLERYREGMKNIISKSRVKNIKREKEVEAQPAVLS